mgnify:CR=1 FL=1
MAKTEVGILLAVLALAAVFLNHSAAPAKNDFQLWKEKFNVKYESMFEEAYRERVFLENLAEIRLHNSNNFKTYEQGVNQFTAMTQEEFEQNYLGLIVDAPEVVQENNDYTVGDVDWNSKGYVTAVKNQGQCGSCWAFSTTGGLEGLSKEKGNLESFSEQQLVDCSGSYGNQACNGGLMTNAFKYVRDKGLVHEDEYAYKAVKQACKQDSGPFKISGYTEVRDCNTLSTAIQSKVVSVAVDATNWSRYSSGVFNNCSTRLNHGVTLVGVNDNNWVIKNSWGGSWGEKGFIRLAAGNTCGVCNMASYPNA